MVGMFYRGAHIREVSLSLELLLGPVHESFGKIGHNTPLAESGYFPYSCQRTLFEPPGQERCFPPTRL